MELDHVFVLCDVGAPEAEALCRLGLREGPPNTHPGQGTACRRFFVGDTYLELLWVADAREARGAGARTRLWERWQERRSGACPFGVILRPSDDQPPDARPPFPTWRYTPSYVPAGTAIDIGDGAPSTEPFVAWLGFRRGPVFRTQPIGDAAIEHLTHACLEGPLPPVRSAVATGLVTARLVDLDIADRFRLTLTFDCAQSGQAADLTAALPLVLRW